MTSEQLFEDYDPDEEDVFGRNEKITPRCVTVTEKQKADPLRKPKVILGSILSAEKLPINVKQIEQRMMEEDGRVMDPTRFGFKTLEDLLAACSDTVIRHRTRDAGFVYTAKVNEANQEIMELVQMQSDRTEARRAPRSLIRPSGRGNGTYGAAFRSNGAVRVLGEDMTNRMNRGTPEQFQARYKLGPAKTAARVSNLAEVLRSYRSEIGKEHPHGLGRPIVSLAALQEKFREIYGLPAWGKLMSETELHEALDKPEFSGILSFWKFREDGEIYVEEVKENDPDVPRGAPNLDIQPNVSLNRSNASNVPNRSTSSRRERLDDESINSLDDFSVADTSANSNMLLDEEKSDGFFESGPGFGGNVRQPTTDSYSELAARFRGAPNTSNTSAPAAVEPAELSQQDSTFGFNSREFSFEQRDAPSPKIAPIVPPMRPVDAAFASGRAIIPRNPMKLLADFIKMRGSVSFASLPDDDQMLVNFSKNVFKVFTTQPGDMQVRLVDPEIDTAGLIFDDKQLRDPVEADLRWMWEQGVLPAPNHRCLVKPVMFVPPRGFLVVAANDEEVQESNIDIMERILRAQMQKAPIQDLRQQDVRPGTVAVYMYQEGREVHYYRVLILGSAHKQDDIMVLLVDYDDQYCVDVQLCQLFVMPEKVGFKAYPPKVYFATIHGVHGMSEKEQEVLWKNVDDEDRKNFVVAVFNAEQQKVLNVDMVWKNEFGDFQWMSQIAKRRGAVMSSDAQSMGHLERNPRSALVPFGEEYYMTFLDRNPVKDESKQKEEVVEPDSRQPALCATPSRPSEAVVTPSVAFCLPDHVNALAVYDEALRRRDYFLLAILYQFARSLAHHLDDSQWANAAEYMKEEALSEGIRL